MLKSLNNEIIESFHSIFHLNDLSYVLLFIYGKDKLDARTHLFSCSSRTGEKESFQEKSILIWNFIKLKEEPLKFISLIIK